MSDVAESAAPADADPAVPEALERPVGRRRASREVIRRGIVLLWRAARAHPVPWALAVLGAVFFALATVASTAVLGRVTDELIVPGLAEGGGDGDGTFGSVSPGTVLAVTASV